MLRYHPARGTILICDFNQFQVPEMTKRRPVIVLSQNIFNRPGLCTIVALSTTTPCPVMPYHKELIINPVLPFPYNSPTMWIKGDMIYSLSLSRMNFPFSGKDNNGRRIYDIRVLGAADMNVVEQCVLNGLDIHC